MPRLYFEPTETNQERKEKGIKLWFEKIPSITQERRMDLKMIKDEKEYLNKLRLEMSL